MSGRSVPFLDLRPGADAAAIREAFDRVVSRGWFVLGPEVEAFEQEFGTASGVEHAIGVGNGTDALSLLLRALDIGNGDEVLVPALTAAFSAMAVLAVGATPVFVDVEPGRLTIDPDGCAAAVTSRTRAIMPVHLYGQAADMSRLRAVADRHALAVVEDCCQAHLATCDGVPVGSQGAGGAFSFYPTKNLAALGDGGAVITRDEALATRIRRMRNGGQAGRYAHIEPGINSRLDELQAAILRARLVRLPSDTRRRREIAAAYRRNLPPELTPVTESDQGHVYHLFPVQTADRDGLRAHLEAGGVGTLVHYPFALNDQPAFTPFIRSACPVAARAAAELLSLPLHPRLSDVDVMHVVATADTFQKGPART